MSFTLEQLTRGYPLPGTSRLFVLDKVRICGYEFPLAQSISCGTELDIEKRREPGSDYSTYVSHGLDTPPTVISLLLFYDLVSKKDWYSDYLKIHDKLTPRGLSRRNAVPVYHPWFELENLSNFVVAKRHGPTHQRGQFFTVTLEGYNAKTIRIGSGTPRQNGNDGALATAAHPEGIPGKSQRVGIRKDIIDGSSAAPRNVTPSLTSTRGRASR